MFLFFFFAGFGHHRDLIKGCVATYAQDVRRPTKGKPVREEAMQYMARS